MVERKTFLKQLRFILPIGVAMLFISSPASAQDLYAVDNPTPSYIEGDTVLSLAGWTPKGDYYDEVYVGIDLPFPFTFYKKVYNRAYVSENGYLNFLAGNSLYRNTSIAPPNPASPNAAIYAFWDDLQLQVDGASSLRTRLLGTAPKRQFVIEWRDLTVFQDHSLRFNFEIVLNENGSIVLQYRGVANDRQKGNSATVGIEDETASSSVQFSYNLASIQPPIGTDEYAIRFAHLPKPVPVDIKPRACPNHLDVDSHGVFHVAILGTPTLDVTTIDPKTVTMEGVSILAKQQNPLVKIRTTKLVASKLRHQGWTIDDVGTPCEPFVGKTDPRQCNKLGPDEHLDLLLRFDTGAIAASLGDVKNKEPITLQLRGQLLDGTEIAGEDVVIIKKEKHHGWGKDHDWDNRGHHKGHYKDREHGHDKDHEDDRDDDD